MIRQGDQIRLSLQKLRLRKRRAAFAVVSVALGVIVVVTVNSLMDGVRNVAITTLWTEEIDKNVIRVSTKGSEYDYESRSAGRSKTKERYQFLTEAVFDAMRGWPGVAAADRAVPVHPVTVDAWANRPQPVTSLRGVPAALLQQYVRTPGSLAAVTNMIPLVAGERLVRLRFDNKTHKLVTDPAGTTNSWIGREVTIVVGDNYTDLSAYEFNSDKRSFEPRDPGDITAQRDEIERNLRAQYDLTIYNTTLTLRGRIVGLRPGSDVILPTDVAVMCEQWLDQRRGLARWSDAPVVDSSRYESGGRRRPRPGEYRDALVVVDDGADIEAIAKRIEEMGFYATTRARAFENRVKEFDSAMRVVKGIAYAIGGVLLVIAGGLLWSTTSRVVSDSRADIGLFRALGATKSDIRRLFLGESVLLGVLGTIFGTLTGWALAAGISHWIINLTRAETYDPEAALLIPESVFAVDVKFSFALLVGAAIISLLAGLWPANRAANVDPVKALKRE